MKSVIIFFFLFKLSQQLCKLRLEKNQSTKKGIEYYDICKINKFRLDQRNNSYLKYFKRKRDSYLHMCLFTQYMYICIYSKTHHENLVA